MTRLQVATSQNQLCNITPFFHGLAHLTITCMVRTQPNVKNILAWNKHFVLFKTGAYSTPKLKIRGQISSTRRVKHRARIKAQGLRDARLQTCKVIGDSHDGQTGVRHLVAVVIWSWTWNVAIRDLNVLVGSTPTDTIGPRSRSRLLSRYFRVLVKWRKNRGVLKVHWVFSSISYKVTHFDAS